MSDAGYEVEVIGGWFDAALKTRDQELLTRLNFKYTPVLDLVENSGATRFAARLKRKAGDLAHSAVRLENSWQLSYFTSALRRAACRSRADLLIAHSEPTMAAVAEARQRNGCQVGVDMEDWFSEDGAAEMRKRRPVRLLHSLEQTLLRVGIHRSCTSREMSDALAAEFGCKPPVVVYNAFPWSERKLLDKQIRDRKNVAVPSIHWYSQTLGQWRGLEDLIAALPLLERDVEIHLRGKTTVDFEQWLKEHTPAEWHSRIFIHKLVTNDELLSRISEHDIGFAGEGKYCRNKELTISNKILQYLLAGLAVVASNTIGHSEVAEQANGGVRVYKSGNPHSLAAELNALLTSPAKLSAAKTAALQAAENTFCWERQSPGLLRSIDEALAGSRAVHT